MNEDLEQYMESVSPKYYRDFRLLYNELLGYVEREEYDKIKDFELRLNHMVDDAMGLQQSLQYRLNALHRDTDNVKKQSLHHQYRHPKTTIPVTHPFPLPVNDLKDTAIPDDRSEPDHHDDLSKPIPTTKDSASSVDHHGEDAETKGGSKQPSISSLEHDRKIDDLLTKMNQYQAKKSIQVEVDDAVVDVKRSSRNVQLDQSMLLDDATMIQSNVGNGDIDSTSHEGVSLSQEFLDNELAIRSDHVDDGVPEDSSKPDESIEALQAEAAQLANEEKQAQVAEDDDPGITRRRKIWDYIEQDQSSGDINNEL